MTGRKNLIRNFHECQDSFRLNLKSINERRSPQTNARKSLFQEIMQVFL